MKTNEVTGRFKSGEVGIAIELGRPGTGARFRDVEKVTQAVAKLGVELEPQNPLTFLITDSTTGRIDEDVLDEKVYEITRKDAPQETQKDLISVRSFKQRHKDEE